MSDPVVINDNAGHERIRIGEITELGGSGASAVKVADYWGMRVKNSAGVDVIEIGRSPSPPPTAGPQKQPPEATFALGGGGFDGHLSIRAGGSEPVIESKFGPSTTPAKGSPVPGVTPIDLQVGNAFYPGSVTVAAASPPNTRVVLYSSPRLEFVVGNKPRARLDGENGDLWLGGNGTHGDVVLFDDDGDNATVEKATVHIRARNPALGMNVGGKPRARIDGVNGNLWLGGNGTDGNIVLFKAAGDNATVSSAAIHLRADLGDIVLQNADCAEEFEVAEAETPEAGTVMVIDENGALTPCTAAYDRRVAGVISGAGDSRPGIVLGRKPGASDRHPLALVGRVFCKVDADAEAIEVGDLLTTSLTRGHAMKATDAQAAFGSVIGKALAPLRQATGLIPILVTLQ
ncbi:MAG TPA: hypothetical protein VGQ38_10080 [Gaiellaceae bacterium]|jgi:hypothetical protein|nr:hypothetical protein [Gaiellaceae bacterium]